MKRLTRLADGALEAGWLSTVVLTPLFMDKTGGQVFEPPKAGLVRALALFMLAAWAVRALSSPSGEATKTASDASALAPLTRLLRSPLIVSVALVVLTTVLSTLLSIAPYESWWGHRETAQGALNLLAQVAIFAALASNLCSVSQLRRLVTALILPSLPIALYAIFQRFGLEPLQVTVRETEIERVTSLLGQPVYLGAYLGMVMPFTAWRLVEAWRAQPLRPAERWLGLSAYAALLVLQGAAALLTESRGPGLALCAAAALAVLACAARSPSRRLVVGLLISVGAAGLVFGLGLPGRMAGPGESVPDTRMARRAAETFAVGGGGGQFRATSWQVAERVLKNAQPIELADGQHDPRPGLRKLVGYGPEVQYAISPPFYDAELTKLFSYFLTARYHNDLWDVVITCGILGLFAWLALQSVVFWLLVRELGLAATRVRVRGYWAAYVGCALLGALVAVSVRGLSFVFLGLEAGAVAGIALFFAGLALRAAPPSESAEQPAAHDPWLFGLSCAALAALAAHLIETSFSFTVAVTGVLFWILCALPVVSARLAQRAESEAQSSAQARAQASGAAQDPGWPLADAALLALALVAIGFAFLGATGTSMRPGTIIWNGLTALSQPADGRYPVVAIVAAVTLLLGALLLALEAVRDEPSASLRRHFNRTAFVAAALGLVYWLRLAFILSELAKALPSQALVVATQLDVRSAATRSFYLASLLLMLLLAATRLHAREPKGKPIAPWRVLLSVVFAVLACVFVHSSVLVPARAESAAALGDGFRAKGELQLAEQAYQQARELRPRVDAYDALLAKVHNAHARADAAQGAVWLERGEAVLKEAIAKNPVAGEHAVNLAIMHGQRAQRSTPLVRAALTAEVPGLYQRALRLNPQDPVVWRSWASTQLSVLQDPRGARESIEHALALDPRNAAAHALLGEIRAKLALAQAGDARRAAYLESASAYGKAREFAPSETAYRVNEGKAYLAAGERDKAIASLRAALAVLPAESRNGQAVAMLLRRAEGQPNGPELTPSTAQHP